MMSKLMSSIIINDYNEHQSSQNHNMDLQSVQFVSYLVKSINQYRADNAAITPQCSAFIESTSQRLRINIPENKIALEQELLKKILPFDLDTEYITKPDAAISPNSRQFGMICILFTDIVNYTELARKYDDTIIFQLLYTIYHRFDATIKRYPHLQKVETIGDAYMVVGDIFRNTINHKVVVKEIMQFALTIIQEIKTIKTPDNKPLSLRIGINLGKVSVGILGNEIPRLCVVGNAVNVAARLQSTADVNTIQFSRHIYEQIKDIEFDVQHEITIKENVFLKNLGSVTTFNINPFSGD
jgi:class 3 adenylate cyclase